jgi:thioester reductase-like protein
VGDHIATTERESALAGAASRGAAGSSGVLLTGATGFIGMQLLARYLERTDRRIYTLVRGTDNRDVQVRMQQTLARLYGPEHPYADRVVALRGDITEPGLGLGRIGDSLSERVCDIVHGAASVSFSLGLEASRRINVLGTREVLSFADRCQMRGRLRRMSYVSTAFVSGQHSGRFSEDDLDVDQRFRNPYEASKFEAERMVGRSRSRLPVTVLRPSIVVGETGSGFTTSFNVLYWPLRALARGAYQALPARRDGVVDVVPVDYVADAIFALTAAREAEGATFNLTAAGSASSVGEILDLACNFFGRSAPKLIEPQLYRHVLHPLLLRASRSDRQRRALRSSEVFFPYFAATGTFDDRRTRVALRATGIAPPPLHTYFDRLIEFAVRAEWGRQSPVRAEVCREPAPADRRQSRASVRRGAQVRPTRRLVPAS